MHFLWINPSKVLQQLHPRRSTDQSCREDCKIYLMKEPVSLSNICAIIYMCEYKCNLNKDMLWYIKFTHCYLPVKYWCIATRIIWLVIHVQLLCQYSSCCIYHAKRVACRLCPTKMTIRGVYNLRLDVFGTWDHLLHTIGSLVLVFNLKQIHW